ncbi:MAG TPA: ATP-dependent DNA helicase RecQ [Thermoanaerobaculia bacterium]|nr:ATP-dependent DNA helicase RecQ [Thermoanaerobaculia bacterium]
MASSAPPVPGLRRILRRHFGFHSLREGQEEVIRSVMAGQDVLAILPTGAGKSLCYQLPGLELPGTTVVVSPLISLMKDQVDKLHELGFEAAQVNSTLTTGEETEALEAISKEQRDFVFATPERLAQKEFLKTLQTNRIALFVIDEAHCISEWGHDFRPAYLELRETIAALGNPPVLALTATATGQVIEDILDRLGRPDMEVIETGLYRENLHLEVFPVPDEEHKRAQLARLLREIDGVGIVYTSTLKHCEEVYAFLAGLGFEVARYHGRVGARERRLNQDRFMAGELKAMVATSAFGMGIDKPDLRFVLHYNLPGSLESYYQEAGRAGRDGGEARCILLYQLEDKNTQLFFIQGSYPRAEQLTAVYRALERRGGTREEVPLADLRRALGRLPKAKLEVILHNFGEMGLTTEESPEAYRLRRKGLGSAELDEITRRYEERGVADRDRLKRMVLYAQTALCRWKLLLDYFDAEVPWERCNRCDNCARPIAEPEKPPAEKPRVLSEVLPLPPLFGERSATELAPGESVTLPIYGRGRVEEVAADRLIVAFGDGERRVFRRA